MNKIKLPIVELGNNGFQVTVDLNLYCADAITATNYKYTDRFFIHQQTKDSNNNLVEIIFEAKENIDSITENYIKQFCNDLIDQQVRCIVNRNFGHIRDLIVEEAFKPVTK